MEKERKTNKEKSIEYFTKKYNCTYTAGIEPYYGSVRTFEVCIEFEEYDGDLTVHLEEDEEIYFSVNAKLEEIQLPLSFMEDLINIIHLYYLGDKDDT